MHENEAPALQAGWSKKRGWRLAARRASLLGIASPLGREATLSKAGPRARRGEASVWVVCLVIGLQWDEVASKHGSTPRRAIHVREGQSPLGGGKRGQVGECRDPTRCCRGLRVSRECRISRGERGVVECGRCPRVSKRGARRGGGGWKQEGGETRGVPSGDEGAKMGKANLKN